MSVRQGQIQEHRQTAMHGPLIIIIKAADQGGPSITDWVTAVATGAAALGAFVAAFPVWRQLRIMA
ncbi:hypothetical protein ABH935_003298 [Catenulispora sp. GAS73]